MKKAILLITLIVSFQSLRAQTITEFPNRTLKLNVGRGKLGTGDIQGIMFSMEYEKYFRRKLAWSAEIGTTIHDGSDLFLVTEASGRIHDLSYRYTTAGVQLVGKIGYNFIKTKKIDIGIRFGGLFRYQSSSLADDITIIFPVVTGLPLPVSIIEHISPQRTYSVGGTSQLFASYAINQKIVLGLTTGLQLDTNGDTIFPQLSFTIGRRF